MTDLPALRLPAPTLPHWLERQLPPFRRYLLPLGDQRMHVMEVGSGRPVLMLHGNPTWGFLYRKVVKELLGEDLRLIVPDLIGLGFSDKPADPTLHQLDHHAAWIGQLVDTLQLEDLVFVGQDWGGPIGFRALADRASRVAGVVILNTVIGPPKPGFKATAFHRFARLPGVSEFAFQRLGFPQRALALAQGDKSSIRGEVSRAYQFPLRSRRERVAPLALARMVADNFDHSSIQPLRRCQEFLTSFPGPIAMVWGRRDPVLGSVGRHVERELSPGEVVWTDAGHFLQEEVPETIAQAIRGVCQRAG